MGRSSEKRSHPVDQARKEERKRELKKNKKARQGFRELLTTLKDPKQGYEDLMQLTEEERHTSAPEKLVQIAEKKRELKDALEKLLSRYSASDKEKYISFRRWQNEYDRKLKDKQANAPAPKAQPAAEAAPNYLENLPLPEDIPLPEDEAGMEDDDGAIPLPEDDDEASGSDSGSDGADDEDEDAIPEPEDDDMSAALARPALIPSYPVAPLQHIALPPGFRPPMPVMPPGFPPAGPYAPQGMQQQYHAQQYPRPPFMQQGYAPQPQYSGYGGGAAGYGGGMPPMGAYQQQPHPPHPPPAYAPPAQMQPPQQQQQQTYQQQQQPAAVLPTPAPLPPQAPVKAPPPRAAPARDPMMAVYDEEEEEKPHRPPTPPRPAQPPLPTQRPPDAPKPPEPPKPAAVSTISAAPVIRDKAAELKKFAPTSLLVRRAQPVVKKPAIARMHTVTPVTAPSAGASQSTATVQHAAPEVAAPQPVLSTKDLAYEQFMKELGGF